jgi:hypothetical protein
MCDRHVYTGNLVLNSGGSDKVDVQSLFLGVPCLFFGLAMLFFPRKRRLAAQAKVADRKAQLAVGGTDRYFEEGRTLEAYPLPTTDGKWRVRGAFLTACGIALLGLPYFR